LPAALLPARHWSDPGRTQFNPNSSERRKEGVGETSGQTAGSNFAKALALIKAGPAEETRIFFARCGSLEVRNFIRHRFAGWDLVLTCSPTPSLQPEQDVPGVSIPNIAGMAAVSGLSFARRTLLR
jgi:hypothetical protein